MNFSSSNPAGLITAIVLQANCVRAQPVPVAIHPALTLSGSKIGMSAGNTPALSPTVGTVVVKVVDARCRYPSHAKKKNVLSLTTGPPNVAPYWFCTYGGFVASKNGRALRTLLRKYSYASP